LSKLDVAKKIAGDDPTVNVNTIRRRINQSQK